MPSYANAAGGGRGLLGYYNRGSRLEIGWETLVYRMKRRGLIGPDAPTAAELADSADGRLFAAINANESHVLRGLFPPSRPHLRYELRPRPHGFLLPTKDDRNFISRVLFKNIY